MAIAEGFRARLLRHAYQGEQTASSLWRRLSCAEMLGRLVERHASHLWRLMRY